MEANKAVGLLKPGPRGATVREAGDALIADMVRGVARARGGDPYKPRLISDYRRALERWIYPAFGSAKLPDLRRRQIQALIDQMVAKGYDGSTIRNAIKPLQVIYRRAIHAEQVAVSPCTHLEMPSARGRRERIAAPSEAAALIAAVPEAHRALWATAMYAGLRRGEIGGLMWEDVELERGVLHVPRSWDEHSQVMLAPKSRAGTRTVPIITHLRRHLVEHQALTGRSGGLVFGSTSTRPFTPNNIRAQALAAWERAGLRPITLHECRHTFVSILAATPGITEKQITSFVGHSSFATSLDLYAKLLPGREAEAAARIGAFLDAAEG
jgi:integrase